MSEPKLNTGVDDAVSWYVVYTNPGCEKRVDLALTEEGFRVYAPKGARWAVHARQRQRREYPLFARYIFIGVEPGQSLYPVRNTHGVVRILSNSGSLLRVKPGDIDALRLAEAMGHFDKTKEDEELRAVIKPGRNVKIVDGPFGNFIAQVKRASDKGRVELLLRVFGRESRITLPLANVRLV